jgi:hypothetical protein
VNLQEYVKMNAGPAIEVIKLPDFKKKWLPRVIFGKLKKGVVKN